jgi:hypothetical protein
MTTVWQNLGTAPSPLQPISAQKVFLSLINKKKDCIKITASLKVHFQLKKSHQMQMHGITSPPLALAIVNIILTQIPSLVNDLKEKCKW